MKRALGLVAVATVFGCAHAPTKPGERADLVNESQKVLSQMMTDDPNLQPLLDGAVGYIVFPAVGQGGFIVGGGAGKGVVYENGRQTGFAELQHLEVGALAGGQRYSELVIVRTAEAMQKLRESRYEFGADASATIWKSGAASNANFRNGTAVFIYPQRGAMVNASLGSQRIKVVF